MHGYEAGPQEPRAPREYRLRRAEVERRGRWRAYRRAGGAVALLWVARFPPRMVAHGGWQSVLPLPAEVPARISLVLDLGMILAYILTGFRALELIWSARAPRAFRYAGYAGMIALVLGAALNLATDAVLWAGTGGAGARVNMWLPTTPVSAFLVLTGLLLVSLAAGLSSPGLWWRRVGRRLRPRTWWRSGRAGPAVRWLARLVEREPGAAARKWLRLLAAYDRAREPAPARPERIICCSGGGIRSASFCLGGLEALTENGWYRGADAVVGVSGGGYVAAAYHVVRWHSASGQASCWAELEPPAFAEDSPELGWLRRHTRYLFESARVAALGVLSLLFGIAVNLILLAVVLGGGGWWFGWLLLASGGITDWTQADAAGGTYHGDWAWAGRLWWLPVLGVALFVLEKAADRYFTLDYQWRQRGRALSYALVLGGTAVTLLLIVLPNTLESLHDFAATSRSPFARLVHVIGLVPSQVCADQLARGADACGAAGTASEPKPPPSAGALSLGSLATIVVALLTVVRAARSSLGADAAAGRGIWARLATILVMVRNIVMPWLAAVLIGVVVLVLTARWTAALLTDPAMLADWALAYRFALLVLVIKFFTDANRTSLHHFYRERLSYAFLVRRDGGRIEPVTYRTRLRFSQSAPASPAGTGPAGPAGPALPGPRLICCAVANVSDLELVPSRRGCTPFVFDDSRIGLTDQLLSASHAMTPSGLYEFAADRRYRDATIPAAMAMSGAAVSPLAGRQNVRVGPYRLVLALANARLGVWLPNPLWVDQVAVVRRLIKVRAPDAVPGWHRLSPEDQRFLFDDFLTGADRAWLRANIRHDGTGELPGWLGAPQLGAPQPGGAGTGGRRTVWLHLLVEVVREVFNKPGPLRLAKEAIGKTSVLDRRLYITDGGHYDNLGLVEALRRQPREVIVLDASNDPEDSFQNLGQAIATARIDLGCEVEFDPRQMRRLRRKRSGAAWGRGTVRYRDHTFGTILLAKVILVDGMPWDLETYSASNPQFPRTSSGDQLYGEFDLEAYRVLGREVTKRLMA